MWVGVLHKIGLVELIVFKIIRVANEGSLYAFYNIQTIALDISKAMCFLSLINYFCN